VCFLAKCRINYAFYLGLVVLSCLAITRASAKKKSMHQCGLGDNDPVPGRLDDGATPLNWACRLQVERGKAGTKEKSSDKLF